MIELTLAEIASVVGGSVHAGSLETVVSGPAFIDSRKPVAGGLFVAFVGEHVDGHEFAVGAVEAGAAAALTERPVDAPCVVVSDALAAMGVLARHVVSQFDGLRVIGVTGSQGKTSTKDLIAQLLEPAGETIATEGSLNNEIGVPLTALRADRSTRFLVVEMGARGRGHIAYLADMVGPSIGAVLNVGVAHLGEFGSQDDIAVAKGELVEALPSDGVAVLNADDPRVAGMRGRTSARVLTFGESTGSDVGWADIRLDDAGRPTFALSYAGAVADVALPLVGEHQAVNATAAAAVALGCGVAFDDVVERLASVTTRSRWRMEVSTTASGVTVVNDAYNANPDSMRAALKTLAELGSRRAGSRTIAVLGEMRELGAASRDEHDAIGRLAVRLDIDQLVVVGDEARAIHLGASLEGSWDDESVWVADSDQAIAFVTGVVRPGDVVLVKASRAAGLERIAAALVHDREVTG